MHLATKEAYVNEYKGNLYEYLVASFLAEEFELTSIFNSNISPNFRQKLIDYETQLRKYAPAVLATLPEIAKSLAKKISIEIDDKIENIFLIGKIAAGSHDKRWAEADLVLVGRKQYPISVKLSKQNAFVNTKSAGFKSFFSQYFGNDEIQGEVNNKVDYLFSKFSQEIHEQMDIEYFGDFKQWVANGQPELPGQLAADLKPILHHYYHELAVLTHEGLSSLLLKDNQSFCKSLMPLIGHGDEQIIQLTSFYQLKDEQMQLSHHQMESYPNLEDMTEKVVLLPPKKNTGNFEIGLGRILLQIRVKPMNKFTSPSYKLNCSVKHLD